MNKTEESELVGHIEKCINSLGEKFIKQPYNFFTESDAHSFLYYYMFRSGSSCLKIPYPTKMADSTKKSNDNQTKKKKQSPIKTVLIHREYPTSYRYKKKKSSNEESDNNNNLEFPDIENLKKLQEDTSKDTKIPKSYGRGHYDLVVLNPAFMAKHEINNVIAKDYKKWKECREKEMPEKTDISGTLSIPLIAAIEFKLITKALGKDMGREIKHDFQKLSEAVTGSETKKQISSETQQAKHAYMIIFNRYRKELKDENDKPKYLSILEGLAIKYPDVKTIYIESFIKKEGSTNQTKKSYCGLYKGRWKHKLRFIS